jgi:iron complex outermembrane receptor protein
MQIEVTSVSRRPEHILDAAASIFVITADDIRRSGVTSLPEALRLAPNLEVAQVSASGYAISARGFNATSANKLLVLIDGRSVYTPLFSGVFWDVQDVMLEDIDRIEVISGPGGTLWGVNAVNGVINVITRSAKDTVGGLVAAGGGNREADGAIRYGAPLGEDGNYRAYAKYFQRNHTRTSDGRAKDDAWHKGQAGFRADWERASEQFSVIGNAYKGKEGQPQTAAVGMPGVPPTLPKIPVSGVNLLASWKHPISPTSDITLEAYYDRTERTIPPTFSDKINIFDVQLLHSLRVGQFHNVAWGAEYRYGMDRVINSSGTFAFLPAKLNQKWVSIFGQDEMTLWKDVRLTIGGRVEHNDYTGSEFLPNARFAWKPATGHMLWAAASRAVRAPARLDRDTYVPANPPFVLAGGPDFRSETATVFELGYRGQPSTSVDYSITTFYTAYDHLRTTETAPNRRSLFLGNGMKGTASGVEIWSTYQAARTWRLSAGFTGLRERLRLRPGSTDVNAVSSQEGKDPAQTWRLRSSLDLPKQTEFDVIVRRVSALSNPIVPSYLALDLRYGWRSLSGLELSITGQNLAGNGHAEFGAPATRTELRRGVFLKIVSRFGRGTS